MCFFIHLNLLRLRTRTRTGPFAEDRADPHRPEQLLLSTVQNSNTALVQLAGLTESSFTRKHSRGVYCHGQNRASTADTFELRNLSSILLHTFL